MDLDTNVKGFKYSFFFKLLCIFLCFVTFCSALWNGALAAASIGISDNCYNKDTELTEWTNTTNFYLLLLDDARYVSAYATLEKDRADARAYLVKNRDKNIDEAYKLVAKLRKNAEENPEPLYDDDEDYDSEDAYETTVMYDEYTATYYINYDDRELGHIDLNGKTTKEIIAEHYDNKIDDWANNLGIDNYIGIPSRDINYYVSSNGGETYKSNDHLDIKDIEKASFFFISRHGKLEYKGICKEVAEDIHGNLVQSSKYFNNIDVYLWANVEELSMVDSLVMTLKDSRSYYSQYYSFFQKTNMPQDDMVKSLAGAAVLLVISFIFAFLYFSVTGRKRADEKAKLVFYDYIPLELGLGVVAGIGSAAVAAMMSLDGRMTPIITVLLIFSMLIIMCQIVLFIAASSFSRYIRSDKKFYKHLLTYWILFALWTAVRFIVKGIIKFVRKTKASAKRTFNAFLFKPHHFKRNITIAGIIWLAINVGAAVLAGIALFEPPAFSFVIGLALVILDFFVFRKLGEYVRNLDTIIDASSRHEEVTLDLETLDASLRTLAESMRYTNAELQNAIAKAVKDERLRTELITNVSHDLKTPLTSIITYVDLLSKCDITDEKAKEYIRVLDDKGGKLKRLIDDLIEASKVTSGNVTVNLAPMNLSELCLQATVDAQSDFEKAGLELVVKQGEKPTIVIGDGTKANRVIENLLSNARKYSAKASRVYVSVYDEGEYGVFEIKNISAQALDITPEELTERFVRGDKSRNQEGNGLGLSIAKELCTLQNGRLELIIDGDLFKARVKLPNK